MTLDKRKEEDADEPKMVECPDCGGVGTWDSAHSIRDYFVCDSCEGTGEVYDM